MFTYQHQVQFYETDLMGIVHHSNYLRFFEEARVAWAHQRGLIDYQKPESAYFFAVYETQVKHLKPARFGDILHISVQARQQRARVELQYKMTDGFNVLALAKTVHVSLDKDLKLVRLPQSFTSILEKEQWIETWL